MLDALEDEKAKCDVRTKSFEGTTAVKNSNLIQMNAPAKNGQSSSDLIIASTDKESGTLPQWGSNTAHSVINTLSLKFSGRNISTCPDTGGFISPRCSPMRLCRLQMR